jgi:hypothetical protein
MSAASPKAFASARRYFRVEGAGRAEALDDAQKRAFADDLALAAQKREAARRLMLHGARAEALSLAWQALSHARSAAGQVPSQASTHADQLARAVEAEPLPVLDAGVGAAHEDLFEELLSASLALESDLIDATLTERAAATLRWVRPAFAAFAALLVLLGAFLLARKRPVTVEASATAEPALVADHLIDGDEKTEWALPDRTPGYVDVVMAEPRKVARIKLLNSKNLPSGERGVREFKVEAFLAGNQVVKAVEGAFSTWSREPQWQTVDLDVPNVTRLRVSVKTWFGAGGGLTELVVE